MIDSKGGVFSTHKYTFYLDSCVAIAYLKEEESTPLVERLIEQAKAGAIELWFSSRIPEELYQKDQFSEEKLSALWSLVKTSPEIARFGFATYGGSVFASEEQDNVDKKLSKEFKVGPLGPEKGSSKSYEKARNMFIDHEHFLAALSSPSAYLVTSDKKLIKRIKRVLPEYAHRVITVEEALQLICSDSPK